MKKRGKQIEKRRKFSEDFKLKIVSEYERGIHSVTDLGSLYNIAPAVIYRWIYKYSSYNKQSIQVVEVKDSQMHKLKALESRIKDLERAVGQKQMHIDFLEKMIELAREEYDIDIKKNSYTPRSGGSNPID